VRRRASWEYSLKRSWVLALDITYRHGANTNVTGYNILDPSNVQNPRSMCEHASERQVSLAGWAYLHNFLAGDGVQLVEEYGAP